MTSFPVISQNKMLHDLIFLSNKTASFPRNKRATAVACECLVNQYGRGCLPIASGMSRHLDVTWTSTTVAESTSIGPRCQTDLGRSCGPVVAHSQLGYYCGCIYVPSALLTADIKIPRHPLKRAGNYMATSPPTVRLCL